MRKMIESKLQGNANAFAQISVKIDENAKGKILHADDKDQQGNYIHNVVNSMEIQMYVFCLEANAKRKLCI